MRHSSRRGGRSPLTCLVPSEQSDARPCMASALLEAAHPLGGHISAAPCSWLELDPALPTQGDQRTGLKMLPAGAPAQRAAVPAAEK